MSFDPLIANAGRLRILAALAAEPRQPFVQLRNQTGLTDGNLATHARRLQSAGLVAIEKSIADGKPLTTLELTADGKRALANHVQSLIDMVTPASPQPVPAAAAVVEEPDWVD